MRRDFRKPLINFNSKKLLRYKNVNYIYNRLVQVLKNLEKELFSIEFMETKVKI